MNYQEKIQKVQHEKWTSEIIVLKDICERGKCYASQSTQAHDFNGVDIVTIDKITKQEYTIDVKDSEDKNRNTRNFLFTTVNSVGKRYTKKQTDYIAFLNRDTSLGPDKVEIVYIKFTILHNLIETYHFKEYQSHDYELGRYILIPKILVQQHGKSKMYKCNNINK